MVRNLSFIGVENGQLGGGQRSVYLDSATVMAETSYKFSYVEVHVSGTFVIGFEHLALENLTFVGYGSGLRHSFADR
jgi:hypothetical protein